MQCTNYTVRYDYAIFLYTNNRDHESFIVIINVNIEILVQREITDYEDSNDNGTPLPSSTEHYATTTESFDIPSTTSTPDTTTRAGGNESESNVPNLCQDGFDTIAFIRNELFVFKDKVRRMSVFKACKLITR